VLKGEMSLVGPRPLPADDGDYLGDVRRRLLVRPGITGLWQVSGRSDLSWDEAVRLDLYYVDNWSLTYDLSILWRTDLGRAAAQGRLLTHRHQGSRS
jgi:lipopolysaccharide/colanic/teichoic acid biosynthesis glycosyltransferase